MNNNNDTILIETNNLIKEVLKKLNTTTTTKDGQIIYNNETIRARLGVEDKRIRKYREEGLLGFSNVGNKYWYTESDVAQFLAKTHTAPF